MKTLNMGRGLCMLPQRRWSFHGHLPFRPRRAEDVPPALLFLSGCTNTVIASTDYFACTSCKWDIRLLHSMRNASTYMQTHRRNHTADGEGEGYPDRSCRTQSTAIRSYQAYSTSWTWNDGSSGVRSPEIRSVTDQCRPCILISTHRVCALMKPACREHKHFFYTKQYLSTRISLFMHI
jgi:hypothetical protein